MSSNPVYAKSVPTVVATTRTTNDGLSMQDGGSVYAAPLLSSGWSSGHGHVPLATNPAAAYDAYDDRAGLANRRRRKQFVTGACCTCCLLFLLLFFLIPRKPTLNLISATLCIPTAHNSCSNHGGYVFYQTWEIVNRNPYGITLSNVNTAEQAYVPGGAYQGNYIYGEGQLSEGADATVYIPSTSTVNVNLSYNMTGSAPGVIAGFAAQCCIQTFPTAFFTTGSFDFTTTVALHDYRNIGISSTTLVYCCT